jgi:hypothetical protein
VDRYNQRFIFAQHRKISNGRPNESESIIILEDNLAQELLFEQFITDIAVDGANNKGLALADSGLFQSHQTVKTSIILR